MDYIASQNQNVEAQLLNRYGQGDETAFCELVDRYKSSLYAFLRRFLHHQDLVEDVFQETFLQLYISRVSFDTDRPLKPWLFTIAANKARTALRKIKNCPAAPIGGLLSDERLSQEGILNTFICHDNDPSVRFEQSETATLIRNIVASLPERQSEILTLAYFNQFTYKQIAAILKIPIGTVKSRLHTAVRNFAREWTSKRESGTGMYGLLAGEVLAELPDDAHSVRLHTRR